MKKIIVNDDIYLTTVVKENASIIFNYFYEEKEELKDVFTFINDEMTLENEEKYFEKNGDAPSFVIWYKNVICGYAVLYDITDISCSALYYLNKRFRGNGIAKMTTMSLIDYAFNDLNLNKVNFLINTDNENSIKVVESIGLRQAGLLLENDFSNNKYHDQYLYSVIKREWKLLKKI